MEELCGFEIQAALALDEWYKEISADISDETIRLMAEHLHKKIKHEHQYAFVHKGRVYLPIGVLD